MDRIMNNTYTPSGGNSPQAQSTQRFFDALQAIQGMSPSSMSSADLTTGQAQAQSAALGLQANQGANVAQAQQQMTQQAGIPGLTSQFGELSKAFEMYLADEGLSQKYSNPQNTNPYANAGLLAAGQEGNGQIGGGAESTPNPYMASPDQIANSTQTEGGFSTPGLTTAAMGSPMSATTNMLNLLQQALTGKTVQVNTGTEKYGQNYKGAMDALSSIAGMFGSERDRKIAAAKAKADSKLETEVVEVNGKKVLINSQTGAVIKDYGGTTEDSAYQKERAFRTIQSVDELMPQVNNLTVGLGSFLAGIPNTEAASFATQLDTLKSNIAFGELTAMREASKTGGALGQVSDKENKLLESSLAGLSTTQSPEAFKKQLQKVKDSITRWNSAVEKTNGSANNGTVTQNDGTVWKKNTDGSYTRIK